MTIFRSVFLAGVAALALAPAGFADQVRTRIRTEPLDTVVRDRISIVTHRRARLGVYVDMRTSANDSIGATIDRVTPGGPGARAGIRSGDIITRIDGKSLLSGDVKEAEFESSLPAVRLIEYVAQLKANDTISVEYRRDGERRTTTLVTGDEPVMVFEGPGGEQTFRFDWPRQEIVRGRIAQGGLMRADTLPGGGFFYAFGTPLANLELAPLNADLGAYFGTSEGVLVINVPESSSLALKGGDVVLSVDGRKVSSPSSLLRILRSYEPTESIRLEIMRSKSRQTVTGQIGRRGPGER